MAVKWIALQAGQGGNIMLEKMDLKHLLLLLMAAIWVAGLYPERALAETNVYRQYAAELRHCAGTPD